MSMTKAMILTSSLLLVAACDGGGDKGGAKGGDKAGGDTSAAAADVPTEEDFEDEAEAAISTDTVDDEVAKLEKEIGGG